VFITIEEVISTLELLYIKEFILLIIELLLIISSEEIIGELITTKTEDLEFSIINTEEPEIDLGKLDMPDIFTILEELWLHIKELSTDITSPLETNIDIETESMLKLDKLMLD